MATLGDLFFQKVLGQGDPRQELARALATQQAQPGAAAGQPAAAAGGQVPMQPGAAAGAGGATAGQGAPDIKAAQATQTQESYKSPEDLIQLYTKLIERQENVARFDRGVGLIMAGFAHPENRANIINSLSGGSGGGSDPGSFLQTVVGLQNRQMELQQQAEAEAARAQRRAQIPLIAQQLGLDPQVALYLDDEGRLDEVMEELSKPNKQLVDLANGQKAVLDLTTGNLGQPLGPEKKKQFSPMTSGTGAIVGFDPENPMASVTIPNTERPPAVIPKQSVETADGREVPFDPATGTYGEPFGPVRVPEDPTEVQEYKYYVQQETAAGRQPDSYEDWRLRGKKAGASTTTVSAFPESKFGTKALEAAGTSLPERLEKTRSAKGMIGNTNNARRYLDQGIIAGDITSPVQLEGRKVVANLFGIDDPEVVNSDAFMATMQEVVAQKLKAYGAGNSITDKDREYVQKSLGASTTMSPETIRRVLDMQDRVARTDIVRFNRMITETMKSLSPDQQIAYQAFYGTESVLDTIPPEAVAELKKNPTPAEIREFNDTFGREVGEYILAGGT